MSEENRRTAQEGKDNISDFGRTGFRISSDRILYSEEDPVSILKKDPLQILTALKISAETGALLSEELRQTVESQYRQMLQLPWPRMMEEFAPLLCGAYVHVVLDEYREVFSYMIPELAAMFDLDQRSPYHNRDVWHHTLAGLTDIPPVFSLRMTMLLHDIAKPVVFILDDNGRGRFVGHPQKGAEMAYRILRRMEFPRDLTEKIVRLVRYHDIKIKPEKGDVRRILAVFGLEGWKELLLVKHADASGKYERYLAEAEKKNEALQAWADRLVKEGGYFSPHQLNIEEKDLQSIGISDDFTLWKVKERLQMDVADGKVENEKSALLRAAKESEI